MLLSIPLQLLPFYFPSLGIDSASCRNFSPSGWQPPQVAAWGAWQPRGKLKAEGLWVLSSAPFSLHTVMFPPSLPLFSELIHRCYYSEKLVSFGQQ